MKKTSLAVLSIFAIFCVWMIGYAIVSSPLLLPSPLAVFQALLRLFANARSLLAMAMTLLRLLIAMAIALVLGGTLGIIAGFKSGFSRFFSPIVTILRTVPVISVIVIILILFGLKLTPYLITFLMIFPLIYQAFHDGIRNIDSELVDVYKLEDNRMITGLRFCYLPLMRNEIETVLMQSAGLGIKVLVMSEYLSQTRNSIGNSLYLAKINLAYDEVFAWTILLIVLAVGFEAVINHFKQLKQKMVLVNLPKKSITD